jgi:dihydrofolate reductase
MVIYSMGVSLDGYIAGPGGDFSWSTPDAELHAFHNAQARELDAHLYGRGLYETMLPWQTLGEQPGATAEVVDFARLWKAMPKVVFSTTLAAVEGPDTRLARGEPAEELARLGGVVAVGGAGLAATFARLDLIDEYRPIVFPVIVGGGTPFFPALERPLDLELAETRTFGSRVVYLRYRRARSTV